ncbi:MAG: STAS domain-containing protein, partial [Butyrivibrio sp.]|nr:STAS domain-containing protein [Butyrivibrio sp.]
DIMAVNYEMMERVDGKTAPQLDKDLRDIIDAGNTEIHIDMTNTKYMSSAGLRALLSAQKSINKLSGSMVLSGVSDAVKEIFDVTGFSGFLTIED